MRLLSLTLAALQVSEKMLVHFLKSGARATRCLHEKNCISFPQYIHTHTHILRHAHTHTHTQTGTHTDGLKNKIRKANIKY